MWVVEVEGKHTEEETVGEEHMHNQDRTEALQGEMQMAMQMA